MHVEYLFLLIVQSLLAYLQYSGSQLAEPCVKGNTVLNLPAKPSDLYENQAVTKL